mmetsp:Transcript_28476/g.77109  ORF Transcript_28476/g.77109 Transcript_28476/m.77109 type:complete len:1175 (-) Transcript_28476:119-3643(-)|eukprot:CAMPEP_0172369664 /NCGR_PEP_ID=MMETSP1060-20121228/33830_1 /TAXON_ID=37318 /ORGANISM="Pseudo-nitzschia pungens, Strain cf. cingulata" /LENGTH=1174 /DNA_ID=CAMNT_0013094669 /DNA_START=358 /DNA_END=3882 /DNA_ORIENTATION=-
MHTNQGNDETDDLDADVGESANAGIEGEHQKKIRIDEIKAHTCSNTVNSSTQSQTSSIESRKSRRSVSLADKMPPHFCRPYDPMQVVTQEQINAFSLLVSTPIWIFDFIQRKNRYANPAGLDLWSAPSLEEFLNRNMSDMSKATVAITQECQNRVQRAQVVQDMWTFFPKGKARTVQITMTAVRLSPHEDHCSILVVANMIPLSPSTNNRTLACSKSTLSSSSSSTSIHSMNDLAQDATITAVAAEATKTTPQNIEAITISDPTKDPKKMEKSYPFNISKTAKNADEHERESDTFKTSCTTSRRVDGEVSKDKDREEENIDDKELIDPQDDDTVSLDHILESSASQIPNHHHHQMALMDNDNPVNQEILRGVQIIRHLPMAVCQFDMKGRVMFQNPAAYLPALDDEETKESYDDDESVMNVMDTDAQSEFSADLFDEYGTVQTVASNNGRGNFIDRFVSKKVARELLESLQDDPQQLRDLRTDTATVTIEAELYTSTKGRTQWSAIQLRKTKDPVTSRPVILYSAQDKSDAMEAKREREARLQKSEFLAIMAHEIRTPLHQVTGFIDLLELDVCSNPITTISSSGAMNTSSRNNSFESTRSNTQNAMFPQLMFDGTLINGREKPTFVRKVRSTSFINARSPASSLPSSSLPRSAVGNLSTEQKNYIKLLKSSANQLMTVISDVLDYSKLEAGKMKTERIPFELLSVVQGSMEAIRGSCEEKGLYLTLDYGGPDNDDFCEDNGDAGSFEASCSNSGTIDHRKICRRRSYHGSSTNVPAPRRRKLGRMHSFNQQKTKIFSSHPNIRNNDIPFRILGDPNRLRQVLLNLLSNAAKFTEKGGIHVRVCSSERECIQSATRIGGASYPKSNALSVSERPSSLSTSSTTLTERNGEAKAKAETLKNTDGTQKIIPGDSNPSNTKANRVNARPRSLRIVVTDTGMGISKEQQGTIFEKYQQANLSVARNFGGTGLGLSICKLLVEQTMGGSIGVDSDDGQGSSFYVTLPIELPREFIDETSRGANGGKDKHDNGASMNILVAEDNKINQKLVANMLKRMGHKSTLVENGRQAIDMIVKQNSQEQFSTEGSSSRNMRFDAVLMDIQMPVMDGLEATRRLRTMGYSDLPIVGLTASVKRSDYIELGFNDWLPKPILMKDLKAKLLQLQTEQAEDSDESSRAPR